MKNLIIFVAILFSCSTVNANQLFNFGVEQVPYLANHIDTQDLFETEPVVESFEYFEVIQDNCPNGVCPLPQNIGYVFPQESYQPQGVYYSTPLNRPIVNGVVRPGVNRINTFRSKVRSRLFTGFTNLRKIPRNFMSRVRGRFCN